MNNSLIKILAGSAVLMTLTSLPAQNSQVSPDSEMPEYNIQAPYKSKGLTHVDISMKENLSPLLIAGDSKALVPIVCPKERYYRQTALFLKKYLEQATGAKFVITDNVPAKGRAIFIGNCDLPEVKKIFQKAQAMPDESFIIESIPQGIVLAGKDAFCKNRLKQKSALDIHDRKQSRGTFFAMTDFLERLIGVRFYFPGIGIHVPNLRNAEVTIPPVLYSDTPVFDFRDLGYGGGVDFKLIKADVKDARDWNLLSRLADCNIKEAWHTDAKWHVVFGKTHPEYFALRKDGTRCVGDRGRFSSYRCYSSEAGFNAHIKAIEEYYKTGKGVDLFSKKRFTPNKKYISWGIGDAFGGCECKNCRKLTDKKSEWGMYSKLIWRYVIKLAAECKKKWPDKIVKLHLYGRYREIPKFVEEQNPGNLLISPVRPGWDKSCAAFFKEPKMYSGSVKQINYLRKLSAEKPYIWLHYPHAPFVNTGQRMPYLTPHYYKKFFLENKDKLSGVLFNGHGTYSYGTDVPMLYMMYKMSWNPDLDVDSCLDEYCKVMFGPAEVKMKEYYATVIDCWENIKWKKLPNGPLSQNLPKSCYWKETYPRELRKHLKKVLLEALMKTKKGTIYNERVNFMVKGTAPFFDAGRYFDTGKKYILTCFSWKPLKFDGLPSTWWRDGVKGINLVRNDNGKRDYGNLKGKIFVSHDDKNLYIGGKITSKDNFITKGKGKKSPRDSDIWAYDSLEIFLCTEQPGMKEAGLLQQSQYHQIIIDPEGSIYDAYKKDVTANLKIDYKIINQKDKMYFEMIIPFSELKCVVPEDGSKWYINFYWNRKRDDRHTSYTWAGTGRHHDTGRFGELIFTDKAPKEKVIKKK